MLKISVITPYYYGEKYISNLQQMINRNVEILREYGDAVAVEFIIVNDSPVDEVAERNIYTSYSFKIIRYPQNKGIHGARISGLLEAKGDYILFLDQDDEISDDYLLQQYLQLGQNDVVVANAWIEQSDYTKQVLYKKISI